MPAEQTRSFPCGKGCQTFKRELQGPSFISSIFIFTNLVHLWEGLREKPKFKIIFLLHLFSEEGRKVYRPGKSAPPQVSRTDRNKHIYPKLGLS